MHMCHVPVTLQNCKGRGTRVVLHVQWNWKHCQWAQLTEFEKSSLEVGGTYCKQHILYWEVRKHGTKYNSIFFGKTHIDYNAITCANNGVTSFVPKQLSNVSTASLSFLYNHRAMSTKILYIVKHSRKPCFSIHVFHISCFALNTPIVLIRSRHAVL